MPVSATAREPAQLSAAVAPRSTNGFAHSMVIGFAPITLTTGGVVSVTFTARTTGVAWSAAV